MSTTPPSDRVVLLEGLEPVAGAGRAMYIRPAPIGNALMPLICLAEVIDPNS